MIWTTAWTFCVLVANLSAFGNSWVIPRDSGPGILDTRLLFPDQGLTAKVLFERDDDPYGCNQPDDPEVPHCEALCSPSSSVCGTLSRRSSPARSVTARSETLYIDPLDKNATLANVRTSLFSLSIEKRRLQKRAFTPLTQGDIPTYVPDQFQGNFDNNFGQPQDLVVAAPGGGETDATVTRLITFGNQAFQVGSQGLHGCTIITVVSRRAVYMGHYWEVPGWRNPKEFKERIRNWISGDQPRPQELGEGPPLDPSMFNRDDDGTRVYVMHPRRTRSTNPKLANYDAKIKDIKSLINGLVGRDLPTAQYNYIRLNYDLDSENPALTNTHERGIAVFQFDPNGRGQGQLGWRLLYEHNQFQDTDPDPDADSATGIPDQ